MGRDGFDPKLGNIFVNTQDTHPWDGLKTALREIVMGIRRNKRQCRVRSAAMIRRKDEKGAALGERLGPPEATWAAADRREFPDGDIAWQVPLAITEELRGQKQKTAVKILRPIATAAEGGVHWSRE